MNREPLADNPYDFETHVRQWKQHYNTPLGKGSEQEVLKMINRILIPYFTSTGEA